MKDPRNKYAREHNWDEHARDEGAGMLYTRVRKNDNKEGGAGFTGEDWIVKRVEGGAGWRLTMSLYTNGTQTQEIPYGVNGFHTASDAMRYADEQVQ